MLSMFHTRVIVQKVRNKVKIGILEDITCGLAYMHRNLYVHRDLKVTE